LRLPPRASPASRVPRTQSCLPRKAGRPVRAQAIQDANTNGTSVTRNLVAKGVQFGTIKALPGGTVDTSGVKGVDPDLRVKPFFAQGGSFSIREFAVGAFNARWVSRRSIRICSPPPREAW
jgi:hypothetical protein